MIELYTQRWDIEVSYKTLKSQQELERYISVNGTVAQCCIYAKLLFHNLVGVFRKELNRTLEAQAEDKKSKYVVNITQLQQALRHTHLLYAMFKGIRNRLQTIFPSIKEILHKLKVPIRPDRHHKRWGRIIVSAPSYRFTIDGRNHPKVRRYKGVLMTISP